MMLVYVSLFRSFSGFYRAHGVEGGVEKEKLLVRQNGIDWTPENTYGLLLVCMWCGFLIEEDYYEMEFDEYSVSVSSCDSKPFLTLIQHISNKVLLLLTALLLGYPQPDLEEDVVWGSSYKRVKKFRSVSSGRNETRRLIVSFFRVVGAHCRHDLERLNK